MMIHQNRVEEDHLEIAVIMNLMVVEEEHLENAVMMLMVEENHLVILDVVLVLNGMTIYQN